MDLAVSFCDITFSYEDAMILDRASFDVRTGDYAMVAGANGVGKSTILKLILGELEPAAGCICLFGEKIERFKGWRRIGYVPQHTENLGFPATVREIVSMNLYGFSGPLKRTVSDGKERVDRALELVGLTDLAGETFGTLSGGQLKRTMLARAFLSEPDLLLLDEPTAGLDTLSEGILYETLSKLNSEGTTIIIVTHDVDRVAQYATRVLTVTDTSVEVDA